MKAIQVLITVGVALMTAVGWNVLPAQIQDQNQANSQVQVSTTHNGNDLSFSTQLGSKVNAKGKADSVMANVKTGNQVSAGTTTNAKVTNSTSTQAKSSTTTNTASVKTSVQTSEQAQASVQVNPAFIQTTPQAKTTNASAQVSADTLKTATALALRFGVSVDEILKLYASGKSFDEITAMFSHQVSADTQTNTNVSASNGSSAKTDQSANTSAQIEIKVQAPLFGK